MRQFVKACISKTDNNFIKKKTDNNVFLNPKKMIILRWISGNRTKLPFALFGQINQPFALLSKLNREMPLF